MRTLLAVYVLGAFLVLDVVFTSLPYAETAAIKIAVPPQKVEANVALSSGGLALYQLEVRVTDSTQGTATGTLPVSAKYATGQVKFLMVCSPRPPAPGCQPYTVPAGTLMTSISGVRYVTTSPATLLPPPPVENQYAFASGRAVAPGARGNSGAGTTMNIDNPRLPGGGYLTGFSPIAISGGADARDAQVIQQSDVDVAREALAAKVTYALGIEMMAKADGMTYVVDGPPTLDFSSDRAAGDEAPSFTQSVTGRQSAKAFFEVAAKAILREALRPQVLPGYDLAADRIKASYQFVQKADSEVVVVSAAAVGYAVPNLSLSTVRAQLKGTSVWDANTRLRRDFPGSSIDIRTKPFAFPLLPFVSDRINLTLLVDPAI